MEKNGKNIYVRYMSKSIKYIFSKSSILKNNFTYIIYIYIYLPKYVYLTYI